MLDFNFIFQIRNILLLIFIFLLLVYILNLIIKQLTK
jgi:hypothetical protein